MTCKVIHMAAFVLAVTVGLSAQNQIIKEDRYQRTIFFEGELSFLVDGAKVGVPLLVQEFLIDGGQQLDGLSLPFKGLLIVQLRAGELQTVVDGQESDRGVSEFWVVPPGTDMQVLTGDDSAILKTYLIGEKYLEVAPGKPIVSDWQTRNERFSQLAAGLFARESHLVGDPENPIVRVMDINVGPGKVTAETQLPGAAQLQIISGQAILTIEQEKQQGRLGTTFALGEGEPLTIDNREGKKPAKLRAIVFEK